MAGIFTRNKRMRAHISWLAPAFLIGLWLVLAYSIKDRVFPGYDILNDFENAHALVTEGKIPHAGSVSSFGSFNPPGVSYGLVPGILMGGDTPGAANRLAATFWSALSVLGLFLFVRKRFGAGPAMLATLIYGFGPPGVFFITSLWPRAFPAFLIWLLYFCDLWCVEKKDKALVGVLFTAGFGSYWMLEFLPALLVIPLAYAIYRPPVRIAHLVTGALLFILIWAPYLQFQWQRDFVDLHSLLARKDLGKDVKNDPAEELGLTKFQLLHDRPENWDSYFREAEKPAPTEKAKPQAPRNAQGPSPHEPSRIVRRDRWSIILMGNLRGIESPYLMPIVPWFFVLFILFHVYAGRQADNRERYAKWALCGVLSGLWIYSLIQVFFASKIALSSLVFFTGTAAGLPVLAMVFGLLKRKGHRGFKEVLQGFQSIKQPSTVLLVLFLIIPWALIALLVWNANWNVAGRRFLWLYILQSALMGMILWHAVRLFRRSYLSVVLFLVVIGVVGVNTSTQGELYRFRKGDFLEEGSNKVDIVQWVGDYARSQGLENPSIGYDMPFLQFHLHWQEIDSRYKVGRDFDAQFRYGEGILNRNTSPEGISANDDIIIVDKWSFDQRPANRFWDLRDLPGKKDIHENNRWVVLVPGQPPMQ